MQDTKVKGIVLKLTDYKDADKLASIFTLEEGKIFAKFIGVKKEKAKLKAVAQPFIFAEFNINSKAQNRIITSAYILDSFPNILNDYSRMMNAYIILDLLNSILPNSKPEKEIFTLTINALKQIENNNPYVATIKYILDFFTFSGMGILLADSKQIYFDKINGDFVLKKDNVSLPIDQKVYTCLYTIANNNNADFDFDIRVLKQVMRLLHNIIFIKFGEDIKSFDFI